MSDQFFASVNYPAVLVSGLAYWILGAVWFSALFGNTWGSELLKHGVKIKEPSKGQLAAKLIQTFLLNLVVAYGVAFVVFLTDSSTVPRALGLGFFTGISYSAATLGIAYTWESRPATLYFIDCGYPVAGIMLCAVILSVWK